MGLFEYVCVLSPSPWEKLLELVQNVILSLQAIMQQTKAGTHRDTHNKVK